MAKSRPSVQKRRKEAAKREKLEIKAARKAARLAARENGEVDDTVDYVGLGLASLDEEEDSPEVTPLPGAAST